MKEIKQACSFVGLTDRTLFVQIVGRVCAQIPCWLVVVDEIDRYGAGLSFSFAECALAGHSFSFWLFGVELFTRAWKASSLAVETN